MGKQPRTTRDAGPTLAEVVTRTGLLEKIALTTRSIISRSVAEADSQGRVLLRVVSCHDCTAPKACCNLTVACYLHEALPIAARLVREGRDTPAMRTALRVSAESMENSTRTAHVRAGKPCVLLDADERCTVYTDRPAACGIALVYSPATACSDPTTKKIDAYTGTLHRDLSPTVEEGFRTELGLPRGSHRYMGVMPRMVLLALQAWSRPDYVKFFAQHAPIAAARLSQAMEAT
jgi:Fe-S-cluster containining protein